MDVLEKRHLPKKRPHAALPAEDKQKLLADAAERRAAKNTSSAAVTSSQVEPPIASSEVTETPAPNLEALASLLAGKEMTEEERLKIVAPLMQSLQKIMPNAMQASAVKQFVEWMHPKIGADALLDLATHSEPARVEEYTTRIKAWPVNSDGVMPEIEERAHVKADAAAAKRDALTGIAHCIFS